MRREAREVNPPPQVTTLTVSDLGGSAVPRAMFAHQELLTCRDGGSRLSHVQVGGGVCLTPSIFKDYACSLHVAC